jgi:hypothetical protein
MLPWVCRFAHAHFLGTDSSWGSVDRFTEQEIEEKMQERREEMIKQLQEELAKEQTDAVRSK